MYLNTQRFEGLLGILFLVLIRTVGVGVGVGVGACMRGCGHSFLLLNLIFQHHSNGQLLHS